jgi:hypothetical protein
MADHLARRLDRLEQLRKPRPAYMPTWEDLLRDNPPPPGMPGPDWPALWKTARADQIGPDRA